MAAGDVSVQIVAPTTAAVSGAVTAMRNTANDKWLMTSIGNGLQVLIVNVEEA